MAGWQRGFAPGWKVYTPQVYLRVRWRQENLRRIERYRNSTEFAGLELVLSPAKDSVPPLRAGCHVLFLVY